MKLTKREIARFERHVAGLNKLIADVQKRIPEAQYYFEAEGEINLMSGSSHENGVSQQQRVLHAVRIDHMDVGAW